MEQTADNVNRTHITIINQGVDFIIDNLYENITVEMIADHCCFSRYYYNRLFKSITESVRNPKVLYPGPQQERSYHKLGNLLS